MHALEVTFTLWHRRNNCEINVCIASAGDGSVLYQDVTHFPKDRVSLPDECLSQQAEITQYCGFVKSDNSIWLFSKGQGLNPQLVPFEGVVTDLEDDVHYFWHSHAETV